MSYWQYIPARRPWYLRALDAVRDIPHMLDERITADEGWRVQAWVALLLLGFALAFGIWLIGWALRGWTVQ